VKHNVELDIYILTGVAGVARPGSGVDPGGRGGRLPPVKIYLGESILSPPQSFSLCISYTLGKTLRGRKDTQNESRGDGDSETVDERDMSHYTVILWL